MKIIIIILLFLCSVSIGQISLTSDDLLGLIGSTCIVLADTTDSITVDVGSAGENQTWDFSFLQLHGITENYSFVNPNQTVYADSFPQANLVQHLFFDINQSHTYTFFDVRPQYMNVVGYVFDTPEWNIVEQDSNKTALPINYGDNWVIGEIDTVGYPIPIYDSTFTTIDAWGTIIVPAGTFECLRFRHYNRYTHLQTIPGRPPVVIFIEASTISYEWYTKDHSLVAFVESQEGESDLNFTNARDVSLLQDVVISSDTEKINTKQPLKYILHQNYPNPFNATTKIHYQLSMSSRISLKIYDISGKEVKTLVNQHQTAGQHTVTFDASKLPSGIYFYTLKTSNISSTKKMIYLK